MNSEFNLLWLEIVKNPPLFGAIVNRMDELNMPLPAEKDKYQKSIINFLQGGVLIVVDRPNGKWVNCLDSFHNIP